MMYVKLHSAAHPQIIWNIEYWETIFHMETQTTATVISISQKCADLIAQRSVDTIEKLEPIGKTMLYVISQG